MGFKCITRRNLFITLKFQEKDRLAEYNPVSSFKDRLILWQFDLCYFPLSACAFFSLPST
jgi:hypothetical protein